MGIEEEQKQIGARMKAAAQARGLTAYTLSQELGPRPPTIYRWWQGRHLPDREMMRRYADAVGVSLAELYGEGDPAALQIAGRMFVLVMERVLKGELFSRATREVTDAAGPPFANRLTADFYANAESVDQAIRDWVREQVADWDSLPAEEVRRRLQVLADAALDQLQTARRSGSSATP